MTMNRSRWLAVAALAFALAPCARAFCQGGYDRGSYGQGQGAAPQQVAGVLANKLALTDDQRAKITPLIADRQQKLQALRADTSERPMQRARKAKAILEDTDKKIKKLLTPDQIQQYDALEQQMKDQVKERAQAKKDGGTQ